MSERHRRSFLKRTAPLWRSLGFVLGFALVSSFAAVQMLERGWIESVRLDRSAETPIRYRYDLAATNEKDYSYTSDGRVILSPQPDGGWSLRQVAYTHSDLTETGRTVFAARVDADGHASFDEGMGGTILTLVTMLPERPVIVGDSWSRRIVSKTQAPVRRKDARGMTLVDIEVTCEGAGTLVGVTARKEHRVASLRYDLWVTYGSNPPREVQAIATFDLDAGRFERIDMEMPATTQSISSFALAIVRDDETNADEARRAFARAQNALDRAHIDVALKHFDIACRLAPNDADYRLGYCRALVDAHRLTEAHTAAAMLTETNPPTEIALWAHDLRARTSIALGLSDAARSAIARMRETPGGRALSLVREGELLEGLGADPREAGDRFLEAHRLNGSLVEARLGMARCYGKMNRHVERMALLEETLAERPGDVRILLALGRCHLDRNDAKAALEPLRTALDIDGLNSPVRHTLAEAYKNLGDDLKAAEQLNTMLYRIHVERPYPDKVDLHRELAEMYLRLDQPRLALTEYARAYNALSYTDFSSRRKEVTRRLAGLNLALGDSAEAAKLLDGHVKLFSQDVEARRMLARALREIGRRDEALTQYRRVLEIDPKDDRAREALEAAGAL
jgi:tetratricopeptide (TPR) repeat protein